MSNPYDNAQEKVSVLGPTLVFKGELSADEDLMLKGRVEGSIRHTASLRIGKEGSVKGNIKANHIVVEGRVEGDMFGKGAVTIRDSARVVGNVYSPTVSLIEGAHFKGSIDMDHAESSETSRPKSRETVSVSTSKPSEPRATAKVAAAGG
jgi:cytoskeletal protein CcmA (bactofilin family)